MIQDLPPECFPAPLTQGERAGLICTVIARLTSLIFILAVISRIFYRALQNARHPSIRNRRVFTSHMDVYMASLLLAHTVQASTGTFSIEWLSRGSATCNHRCNAQGLIETIGDPAAAVTTLAIAVYIFVCVFFQRRVTSFWIPIAIVCAIWTYFLGHAGVSMSIHHSRTEPLFTPTPYWCWISRWYQRERLTAAYMWYWTTAATTSVLYIILFFYIRSVDVTSRLSWHYWRSKMSYPGPSERATGHNLLSKQSRKMLLYPAVYIAVILPQSLIRWLTAGGVAVAPFWVFLSQCIFSLGGVCDALLLIFTRPHVLGFEPREVASDATNGWRDGGGVEASTRCDWEHSGSGSGSLPHSDTVITLHLVSGSEDGEREIAIKSRGA